MNIKMFFLLFLFPLTSFGKIHWKNKLITFTNVKFYIDSFHVHNYNLKTSDNAQVSIFDKDTLSIIAIDTNEITLTALDIHTKKVIHFSFKAKANQYVSPEWNKKDLMGLHADEASTFMNFYFLKFLHKPFPTFNFYDAYLHQFTNDSLLGKTTLVDFWYFGCSSCLQEIPYLNSLLQKITDENKFQLLSFYDSKMRIEKITHLVMKQKVIPKL